MIKENKKLYKAVYQKIKEYDRIVVFRHELPDYDALGTQMGLVTFLRDNFPSKDIHYVGHDHVSFTPRLYPYMEKLEDAYFDQRFLAIVVDTGNTKRIDDQRFLKADYIIKFDHHPAVEQYGNLNIVANELSSCAELVADFIYSKRKYPLSKVAAMYLFSGIAGDSGRFLFPSTTKSTFDIASKLLDTGLNPSHDVYLKMYQKEIADLDNMKYVLNHFKVSPKGVAYYILDQQAQKELNITPERGKENLSLLSNINGIHIWMSITEDPSINEWRVSIRSKKVAINDVAAQFGGGGHLNASGARLKSLDELDLLVAKLESVL